MRSADYSPIESNVGFATVCQLGLCSVLRPRQHSIGYIGDGFYRSKDPTNSIKVLKETFVSFIYGDTKSKTLGDVRAAKWRAQKKKRTIRLPLDSGTVSRSI